MAEEEDEREEGGGLGRRRMEEGRIERMKAGEKRGE